MQLPGKIKHLIGSEGLAGQSLRAGGYLAMGSLLDNVLRFLRNMILARLLAPEAFGLMAIVIGCVSAMEAFSEVGLRQSIIQNKKGGEREFLNIVWWLSSMRGCFLYGIAFMASPFICDYFNKPEALSILRVGFLSILLNGFVSPRFSLLEKALRFRMWVILMQAGNAAAVLISISAALLLHSVWALIIGYAAEAFLKCALSYVFCPFKPGTNLNRTYLQEILTFSRRMFGLPILMMLFVQVDTFVIGSVLSLQVLGMYSLARDLADLPNKLVNRISPIFLPILSLLQDDPAKLKQSILTLTKALGTFGLPFAMFFIMFSKSLLSTVYATEYSQMALPFSILCVYSLLLIASQFIMHMFIAMGMPQIQRRSSFIRTCSFLILVYPSTKFFGLLGTSSSALIAMLLSLALQILYLRKHMIMSFLEFVQCWHLGMGLALIIFIPGTALGLADSISPTIRIFIGSFLCLCAWVIGAITFKVASEQSHHLATDHS